DDIMSQHATIETKHGSASVDPYTSKNVEKIPLAQKMQDLNDFLSNMKIGMLTTQESEGELLVSRCMALAGRENDGTDLIFHANLSSGKISDLSIHPKQVNISFLNPSNGGWASIAGEATVLSDRDIIDKYYSTALKAWLGDLGDGVHDGSRTDPRIGVIKLTAKTATHTVVDKGAIGRTYDMAKGLFTGEVPAFNSVRELSPQELDKWREAHRKAE
ncbi:hypothetical protein Golomagni_07773, partial [Golovinomyces magnicellulatus]